MIDKEILYMCCLKVKIQMFRTSAKRGLWWIQLRELGIQDPRTETNDILVIYLFVKDPRVLDAMMPYSVSYYGNPHSRTHAYGWESEQAVEHARKVHSTIHL